MASAGPSASSDSASPSKPSPSEPLTAPAVVGDSAKDSTTAKEVLKTNGAKEESSKDAAAPAKEEEKDDKDVDVGEPSSGPVVDMEVFGQLLEIDDDDEHEFSKTLAFDYIGQAETTFVEIDEALAARDLDALSRKGHYLKGSSAALGLQRVQHSCESLQHCGARKSPRGEGPDVSEDEALARCAKLMVRLRKEQAEAKEWIEGFYKAK
ncbi:hypothetical protein JCM8547_007666 [Rhodosporidiobolus lusitaniae]